MTLDEIKAEAACEKVKPIEEYICKVQDLQFYNPLGIDFKLPRDLAFRIEKMCDDKKIPIFHIADGYYSTAANYTNLLAYERRR